MAARRLRILDDPAETEHGGAAAAVANSVGEVVALPDRSETGAVAAEDALVQAAALLIAAGYRVIPPGQTAADEHPGASIADELNSHDDVSPTRNLSAREHEVLMLLAEGAPNKVIARRLDISVHTAKFHVASILAKLGAVNRTDAIAIAMREGLVLI